MVRRLRTLSTVVVAVLATAGIAVAAGDARPCHPDLPGTKSLSVRGRVDSYSLRGWRVPLYAQVGGCERRIVWRKPSGGFLLSLDAPEASFEELQPGLSALLKGFEDLERQ